MALRVVSVLSTVLALGFTAATPAVAEGTRVDYGEWRSAQLVRGEHEGTVLVPGGLAIGRPIGVHDGYDYARWTSPRRVTGFDATQAVASWNADTPPGSDSRESHDGHITVTPLRADLTAHELIAPLAQALG